MQNKRSPLFSFEFIASIVLLAAVYYWSAQVGYKLSFIRGNVTLVWPPSGIALVALVLFGGRLWPGVALGALIAELGTGVPVLAACGVSIACTLEALLGAYLLRRLVHFRPTLEGLKDVLGLLFFGAVLSSAVGAVMGVTSLSLGSMVSGDEFVFALGTWWAGDAMSILFVAPLLLSWSARSRFDALKKQKVEAAILAVLLVAFTSVAFGGWIESKLAARSMAYVVFPLIVWSALRFGQRETATIVAVIAVLAIWGTTHRLGPFIFGDVYENLVLLQIFVAIVATTGLILGAVITERKSAEEALYRSGRMLELILDNIPQRVFWKDRNSLFLGCNKHFAVDAGLQAPSDLIGKTDFELSWRDTAQRYRDDDRTVMDFNSSKINFEEPQSKHDGGTLWLRTSKVPLHDTGGNVIGVLGTYEDITEAKLAEEELHLQKAYFQKLFENSPEGIVILNNSDKIVDANKAFQDLFEYSLDEVEGKDLSSLIVPANLLSEASDLSERVLREEVVVTETVRRSKHGAHIHVSILGSPIMLGEKQIGVYGIYRDITERRRSGEALRKAEEKYRTIFDNAVEGIYQSMPDGRFITANPALARMLGYASPDELIALITCIEDELYVDRNQRSEFRAAIEQRGSVEGFESRLRRKDGTAIWVSENARVVRDEHGAVLYYEGRLQDITERKQIDAERQEHAQRLRTVIETVGEGITLSDKRGHFELYNSKMLEITGYGVEEANQTPDFSALLYPDPAERQRALDGLKEILASGEARENETVIRAKDGSRKTLLVSSSLIRYREAEMFLSAYRDITGRKRTEEQLKDSLKEKEVLLKEIHHRVKNNLQIVSSLLSLQAGYIKDKHALSLFKESQDRVRSMALIHEKLYQSDDLAKVDFGEYLRNVTTSLYHSYKIDAKAIALRIDVDSLDLNIDTAIPCGLIVNELVSNALKYAFPHRANNGHSEGEIHVSLQPLQNGTFVLAVSDNGVGFPAECDFRTTESLGLQLVTTLADQLQGTIELDSSSGTKFTVTFSAR